MSDIEPNTPPITPAVCPCCDGTGREGGDECDLCAGFGTVHPSLRAKVLEVRVEREKRETEHKATQ